MKKHLLKGLLKNRTPYALVIKIVFVILTAYSIIQLSNEAKRIEEKANTSVLRDTIDYAEKYICDKYAFDWTKQRGCLYKQDDYVKSYDLILYTEQGEIEVHVLGREEKAQDVLETIEIAGFQFYLKEDSIFIYRRYDENTSIYIAYNGGAHIDVYSYLKNGEDYLKYNIEFVNGEYISNLEMEQQLGIPTDEIVALAEDTRQLFEEEMLKMHHYQIDKARRNRGRLANAGILFFVVYAFILWDKVRRKVKLQGKPAEVCLGEVLANTGAKILRGKYELLGIGSVFWIYILKPIISEFLLFPLEGQIKNLVAYGISAVLVVLLCVLLFFKGSLNGREPLSIGLCFIRIFRTFLGIVIAVSLINLGVGLVSDFYPHSWQFYVINYMTASVTAGILCIWGQMKRRREEDVR